MRPFLEEIQATLDCGIWSTALASALIVPDACGAIEFPGQPNGQRYRQWYDANIDPFIFIQLSSGDLVWKIRNAMQHEVSTNFDAFGFQKVIFTVPHWSGTMMDQNVYKPSPESPSFLNLDLSIFVQKIITGAERWLETISNDTEKQKRLDGILQFRPAGFSPFIVGFPLIA